jgi:ATP-dependent protease ClpP protease subunit
MPVPKRYLAARAAILANRASPRTIPVTNESGVARVNIYDEIGLWGITAADFSAAFEPLNAAGADVHVHINSPGGDVYDGLAIYHSLKHSAANITVHVDGLAASAASFIAMAGDQIIVGRNSRMMIHDASTMTYGNAQDHIETSGWLNEESDNISDIYAQRAGGEAAAWRATMKSEAWYGSEQAVAAGLADMIEGTEAPADKAPSVAASLFKDETPDGPPAPVIQKPDPAPDFDAIALALKGAFT